MNKIISGFCPIIEEDYSISVSYVDVSTLSSKKYIKSLARCEHSMVDGCPINECPILKSAPEAL